MTKKKQLAFEQLEEESLKLSTGRDLVGGKGIDSCPRSASKPGAATKNMEVRRAKERYSFHSNL